MHIFSTLNFWLQDAHEIPTIDLGESYGIAASVHTNSLTLHLSGANSVTQRDRN